MRQKKALIALTITVLGSHSGALLYIMWFLWVLKKINNNYYSVRDRSRKGTQGKNDIRRHGCEGQMREIGKTPRRPTNTYQKLVSPCLCVFVCMSSAVFGCFGLLITCLLYTHNIVQISNRNRRSRVYRCVFVYFVNDTCPLFIWKSHMILIYVL